MFPLMAWRNIWRNPRRSGVLISAVAAGIFSFLGLTAYMAGFSMQWLDASIRLQGGHILIAGRGYYANPEVRNLIKDVRPVEDALADIPGASALGRLEVLGIVNSAAQASAVQITGVNPLQERRNSPIPGAITAGVYMDEAGEGLVMGAALADKLQLQLGERAVLMVNDLSNELASTAVRVIGLYESASRSLDERVVFLHRHDMQALVGFEDHEVSTVSVFLDRDRDVEGIARELRAVLADPSMELLTWRQRLPMIVSMESMLGLVSILIVVILFAAIGFTLINSFLMVIYERMREIGIMMANGVAPGQIRHLIWLEAGFMVLIGVAAGSLLAFGLIAWWSRTGLDLSAFAEGLRSFGADTIVYPRLDSASVLLGYITVMIMITLAVAWPAWKASRFRAVDALQHT
ncbi:MAG: FtsX-like permease family protein [Bacteroidota bacterium]|nr:FtsX-like permease family protein [Bacteroidota bacterium]